MICQKAFTLNGRLAYKWDLKSDSTNATIACYCRVSSLHQKNDAQRAEIGRWLHANSLASGDVLWFEDNRLFQVSSR